MATGITVTMLCPGPTFSNLLAGAATEKSGEVSYLDSWLCHKVGTLVKFQVKVENNLKGSLDLFPSPSPSVKIQIMGRKVCLKCM